MGDAYWVLEYLKVMAAYIFLMFIYPSIVFRSYLKGKSRMFWFGFCCCGQVVLVSSVVLLLGVGHILNVWVFRALFYGSLIWSLLKNFQFKVPPRYFTYKFNNHTYGPKLLLLRIATALWNLIKRAFAFFWKWIRRDTIELIGMAVVIGYGVLYFSYGPLQNRFYGFSDIIVHQSWTYGLIQGQIYSGGIYPAGMHCMAYAISELFGIRLYTVITYMQCIHMVCFLTAAYFFARELFAWKYTALLGLTLFLTMKHESVTVVYLLSRMQTALPQEFGLYTVFMIPTFLIRYLKHAGQVERKGKKTRFYWDDNLVVFVLGIAASLSCHFYATIMAIFTCAGVGIIWCVRLFNWRRLVPVVTSALLALLIAVVPMGLALAEGIPLEHSLYWALSVIEGTRSGGSSIESNNLPISTSVNMVFDETGNNAGQTGEAPYRDQFRDKVIKNAVGFYNGGYKVMYSDEWSAIFLTITGAAFAVSICYRLLMLLLHLIFRKKKFRMDLLDGYAIIASISILLMLAFSSQHTIFPTFVAVDRVCSSEHMSLMLLTVFPLDLIGLLLSTFMGTWTMQTVGVLGASAVAATVVLTGNFHGFLYLGATRFDAAVNVTNAIIDSISHQEFTIISPTDELYQVRDYGFHEEYLTLIEDCQKEEYYLPTQYLFFYLEKKPIQYDHSHFPVGPAWIAQQRYAEMTFSSSVGSEYTTGSVSQEKLEGQLFLGAKPSNGYTVLYNREIVETRAWNFWNVILERYPNNISVYYEDDYFVCYCLKQNPDRLINLSILDT